MANSRKRNKVLSSEITWANLHLDLLLLVVRKIDSVEDYFHFRSVCTEWRLAASYEHDFNKTRCELPMLLETRDERLEFSTHSAAQQPQLTETGNERWELSTPMAAQQPRAISRTGKMKIKNSLGCRGWLLVVETNGDMNLVHGMSGACIKLPSFESGFDIDKISLSSSPLIDPSNFTLLIVYRWRMAYWRLGDKTFTKVEDGLPVLDVIFSSTSGVFYVLSTIKQILILSIKGNDQEYPVTLVNGRYLPSLPKSPSLLWNMTKFLVESDGNLLLVVQHEGKVEDVGSCVNREVVQPERKLEDLVRCGSEEFALEDLVRCGSEEFAFHFHIYKLEKFDKESEDMSDYECEMIEIKNLGNRALFVGGLGASISVNAWDIPGCKPNHIYYTGHNNKNKITHAIYDLANGLVDGCGIFSEKYPIEYPSLWVTPTFV